jgi:tripartite-type tricarboxylate transporter receptor subunit TctC
MTESGLPQVGFNPDVWLGLLAPAGTPPAIVNRLNAELVKAAQAPDLLEKLAADGGEGAGTTPGEFARLIATETARWGKVIKEAGITLEP